MPYLLVADYARSKSKCIRDRPTTGRYKLCHKMGNQVAAPELPSGDVANTQLPLILHDVERAHVCIPKAVAFSKYAVVGCFGVATQSGVCIAQQFAMCPSDQSAELCCKKCKPVC